MNIRNIAVCASLAIFSGLAAAQAATPAPASYASISELNQMIANLQQASQSMQQDLSRLRIEKWKADSGTKRQVQGDTESILRNLQNALPAMLSDLKNSPESLPQTFKVYRNMDAVFDVFNTVLESAGAFGTKEEFQSLSGDMGALENSRKVFAERMDRLASQKETEIGQLRVELQNARAAIPPKKTVVDDTEPTPAKKAPAKKKTPPKPNQTQAKPAPPSQ